MSKTADLLGQKFGHLAVVEWGGYSGESPRRSVWVCRCDCGEECLVLAGNLRRAKYCSPLCRMRWADNAGYRAAHERVRCRMGRAGNYTCSCGAQAQEWAYDHTDPNEMTGVSAGFEVVYSLDPDHYKPMCCSCHRKYDAELEVA